MKHIDSASSRLFLSSIMEILDNSTRERLDQPFPLDELANALKSLEKNKTPGSEGLPAELYSALWELISQDMLQVYDRMLLA
eukprot:g16408.t1